MDDVVPKVPTQNDPVSKKVYIYALSSPSEPGKVRYIGKTIDPQRRLAQHIHNKDKNHRGSWLTSLRSQGLTPVMTIIEETTSDQWKEREIFWIAFYQDHDLTNSTEGGDGHDLAPESRAKISVAAKGRKREFTEEWRHNLGNATRGKKQSSEHIIKRADIRRGSRHTEETKAKISAIKKGVPLNPETKAKIVATQATPEYKEKQAAAHRGKKATPETKARMSAAGRGRQVSAETREKLAAANRGKEISPERRAKISAASKGRVPPNKGVPMSEEQKTKLSLANLGKKASPETRTKIGDTHRGRKQSSEQIAKRVAARKATLRDRANSPNDG